MSTDNKAFKVKNGLVVQGSSATVAGNEVLTTASSLDGLANVNAPTPNDGDTLVYDVSTQTWIPIVRALSISSIFSRQGNLTIATGTQRLYVEKSGILSIVRASVGTPSQGSSIIVDILKNGTTVLGSSISLEAGSFTATGTIANTSVTAGDYFTVNILQVGSITAGANLTVTLSII
jgi:hypothetical protein